MSDAHDEFQILLESMRVDFLDALPEHCAGFERQIMAMESDPSDRESFAELYRGVHSLKGSGGTFRLQIVTTVCHQLENLLSDSDATHAFDQSFANRALAYVDLLRRIPFIEQRKHPDYGEIETRLEELRKTRLQSRKAVLIAESAAVMVALYRTTLAELPLQLNVVDDGLSALQRLLHERFDLVIVGRELKSLNGVALMSAVRASPGANQKIRAILLSSNAAAGANDGFFDAVIARDKALAENLRAAVLALSAAAKTS